MNKHMWDLIPKIGGCVIAGLTYFNSFRLEGLYVAILCIIALILIVIPLDDIVNDKSSNDAQ